MATLSVCHVELRVRDVEKAKAFYTKVFDWKVVPLMPGYLGIDTGKFPGGGIYAIDPKAPAPPGVVNYLPTDDVVAAGERAERHGGKILVPKTEVPGMGHFVDTMDPWGNEVAFWQPLDPTTRPTLEGSGKNAFCWVELSTPKLADAVRYYGEVAGLTFHTSEDGSYAFTPHEGDAIGFGIQSGDAAAKLPGATTYVDVDDLAEGAKRVEAAGGRVLFGPQEIPGTGHFTMFTDPDGIRLALFKHA